MNKLKSLMIVLCSCSLAGVLLMTMPGCESVRGHNELVIDAAISQAVARYIDAGATEAHDAQRRETLIAALSVARQFVTSDQPVDSVDWANEFIRLMDWDALSVPDQILLQQVLQLVRDEIELRTGVDSSQKIYLGHVIDVAINTANSFTF